MGNLSKLRKWSLVDKPIWKETQWGNGGQWSNFYERLSEFRYRRKMEKRMKFQRKKYFEKKHT